MNKFTENWQVIIFTVLITLIGNIVFSQWQINKNRVENAASTNYVDSKDNEIKSELNKKVSKDEFILITNQLQTIEKNQNTIYQILIKQSR